VKLSLLVCCGPSYGCENACETLQMAQLVDTEGARTIGEYSL
jgi:hypothetical protein